MKTLDIVLYKSVGDIALGMSRSDARHFLGGYREFRSGTAETNTFDQFSEYILGYDFTDRVEFICVHSFSDTALRLHGRILSEMCSLELFSFVRQLDPDVDLEDSGISFESNNLGLAAYFGKTPALVLDTEQEIFCERLESISIAIKGYWNRYRR